MRSHMNHFVREYGHMVWMLTWMHRAHGSTDSQVCNPTYMNCAKTTVEKWQEQMCSSYAETCQLQELSAKRRISGWIHKFGKARLIWHPVWTNGWSTKRLNGCTGWLVSTVIANIPQPLWPQSWRGQLNALAALMPQEWAKTWSSFQACTSRQTLFISVWTSWFGVVQHVSPYGNEPKNYKLYPKPPSVRHICHITVDI